MHVAATALNSTMYNPTLYEEIMEDIYELSVSGMFIRGKHVNEFEKAWAGKCQALHVVGLNSGSDALRLSIRHYKHASGKTLCIIPAMSFAATATAAIDEGVDIHFVDVLPNGLYDWDMALADANIFVKDYARIIHIPVHLYGQQCQILTLSDRDDVVIEDACQAHGALQGVKGAVACYSFYPTKNLGAYGS